MIQFIAYYSILLVQNCLEKPSISVECGWKQYTVLHLVKFSDLLFQFFVYILCATYKSHTTHPETSLFDGFDSTHADSRVI